MPDAIVTWIVEYPVVFAVVCAVLIGIAYWARLPHFPMTFEARVQWVCDGDSIYVRKGIFGRRIKLRFLGMDAPEHEQRYGEAATDYLRTLIQGRRVKVNAVDMDQYGRWVARVYVGGQDVSLTMIQAGLAWPYFKFFSSLTPEEQKLYRAAYNTAKHYRFGLWADDHPVAPWKWRYEERQKQLPTIFKRIGWRNIVILIVLLAVLFVLFGGRV